MADERAAAGVAAAPPETSPPSEPAATTLPSEPTPTTALGSSSAALPAFEIETPYPPGHRPGRPTGVIAASTADEEIARWNIGGNGDPNHPSNRPSFHPAVRVIVETRPLRPLPKVHRAPNVLTQGRLLARARSIGYWPFRACFEASLRWNPRLRGGKSRVRISILPNGRVSAARLLATELTDRPFARCLLEASKRLEFTPQPVRRLDVDLSVELWPGDAPLPVIAMDGVPPQFDARPVASQLEAQAPSLARCCAEGLERDPKLWGRAALRLSSKAGNAVSVREEESRYPDSAVLGCWKRSLEQFQPAPAAESLDTIVAFRCGTPPEQPAPSEAPQP